MKKMMKRVARKGTVTILAAAILCPVVCYILISPSVVLVTSYSEKVCVTDLLTTPYTPDDPSSPPPPPPRLVLLVTYGRSGSTFTSHILAAHPGTFFFFEPLRALLLKTSGGWDVIRSYSDIGGIYTNSEQLLSPDNLTQYERNALDILNNLVNCDISKYPVTNYISDHFSVHGDTARVNKCLGDITHNTSSYLDLPRYLQCLLNFQQACRNATLRLFKLIRLPVRALPAMLSAHGDMAVVYLVRDPRAVLRSQQALFGHAPTAANFCRMLLEDARHVELLQGAFPGRVLALRYEDLAREPLTTTRRLYAALGLPLTSQVLHLVRRMTSASPQEENNYSTFRANPAAAAHRWRLRARLQEVRTADGACHEAYDWLGYKAVPDQRALRDVNFSLTLPSGRLPLLSRGS